MEVELEHGTRGKPANPDAGADLYNLTNDDRKKTAMIALAHLAERGDYYDRLEAVEGNALIIRFADLFFIAIVLIIVIFIIHKFAPASLRDPAPAIVIAPTQ
jgi:hypothetical protein